MNVSQGFFKATKKEVALSEIVQRLGGSSVITDFIAHYILDIAKGDSRMKKFPMAVFVHETKPSFALSDGEMLDGHALDLAAMKVIGSKYMGSGDTVYHHRNEQLSEGMNTPSNIIAIFIKRIPCGNKLAWTVDVVGNLQKKLDQKELLKLNSIDISLNNIKKVFEEKVNSMVYLIDHNSMLAITFFRKIGEDRSNDAQSYLGPFISYRMIENQEDWRYILSMKDDTLEIRFESLKPAPYTISNLRAVQYKIDEIDSDINRIKRSK